MKQWDLCLIICSLSLTGFAFSSQSKDVNYQKLIEASQHALAGKPITTINNTISYMRDLSRKKNIEDSFHVVNVCRLAERMQFWQKNLPGVNVHYALKTNDDGVISAALAALGAGFDCASIGEMKQIMGLGVSPDNIIFSHPRKPIAEIIFAEKNHIKTMMFDSIEELDKMMHYAPSGEYILRIKTHDEHSETPLSSKFGASIKEAYTILDYACEKKANITGISFHVGSNNQDAHAFSQAIIDAATLFNYSHEKCNLNLTTLDLGGGWPGDNDARFMTFAKIVNQTVAKYFKNNIKIIAEPGRFFATQTTSAAMRIIGTKKIKTPNGYKFSYYLSNGAYGLFWASIYYQYDAHKIAMEGWAFHPLNPMHHKQSQQYPSTFWGPTCDSGDKILENVMFPRMELNEFIYSKNVGSYTYSGQTAFNQITPSKAYYVCKK